MIVDAELFWIVTATMGSRSLNVLGFMIGALAGYLLFILQKRFACKQTRRSSRRARSGSMVDRLLPGLQVMKSAMENRRWI
jgi:hypothetical protein